MALVSMPPNQLRDDMNRLREHTVPRSAVKDMATGIGESVHHTDIDTYIFANGIVVRACIAYLVEKGAMAPSVLADTARFERAMRALAYAASVSRSSDEDQEARVEELGAPFIGLGDDDDDDDDDDTLGDSMMAIGLLWAYTTSRDTDDFRESSSYTAWRVLAVIEGFLLLVRFFAWSVGAAGSGISAMVGAADDGEAEESREERPRRRRRRRSHSTARGERTHERSHRRRGERSLRLPITCVASNCSATADLMCMGCSSAVYCSKECSLKDWRASHAQECAAHNA